MLGLIKRAAQPVYASTKIYLAKRRIKNAAKSGYCRLVVGASGIYQKGWIPTEIENLNLLKSEDWQQYFTGNSVDAILAEHVWEHLTFEEGVLAAQMCFRYLKPDGYLRVAVPDGLHPDPVYIAYVRPGGDGPGADDHKILYTHRTLRELFESVGFHVDLLEYFDENGEFHCNDWKSDDGHIYRSRRFDKRNSKGELRYTSLIIDARK
jgi:predicted SAM-dependent methyltransferase